MSNDSKDVSFATGAAAPAVGNGFMGARSCYGGDVGGFVALVVVGFFIWFIVKMGRAFSPSGNFDRLAAKGTPARGILLRVASVPQPYRNGAFGQKFERRQVTIDVEVPGQQPYVVDVSALIPRNMARDVLPGVTVEVRVDPQNPMNVTIVGPGAGFATTLLPTA